MNDITASWLKAAEDDLAAIEAMLPCDQLTNVVAFHAQQAVEKAFKGLREQLGLPIPHAIQEIWDCYLTVNQRLTKQKIFTLLQRMSLASHSETH